MIYARHYGGAKTWIECLVRDELVFRGRLPFWHGRVCPVSAIRKNNCERLMREQERIYNAYSNSIGDPETCTLYASTNIGCFDILKSYCFILLPIID